MKIKTFIINAFTNKPFSGNPARICLLASKMEEKIMQSIAKYQPQKLQKKHVEKVVLFCVLQRFLREKTGNNAKRYNQ